jgi:peptidoglycan/LPS O-acetylase OafA/YrhL
MLNALAAFFDALPERLRRVTSGGRFIPEIDGLRFIAIMSVVTGHIAVYTCVKLGELTRTDLSHSFWTANNFASGVELFFAISGFVIALPFLRSWSANTPTPSLKDYFLRRLTRLEPPFILAMTLILFAHLLGRQVSARELLPHWLATIAYLHGPIYHEKSTISFITWSLELEIQFYIFAPVLFWLGAKLRPFARRALWISLMLGSLCFSEKYPNLWAYLPAYLSFFLSGVLAADLAIDASFWRDLPKSAIWNLIAVGGLLCVFGPTEPLWSLSGRAIVTLGGLLSLLSAFRARSFSTLLSSRWITAIGGMCYSIYLLHETLVYALGKITVHAYVGNQLTANVLIQFVLLAVPIFVVSALFFTWIERPCMYKDWPRQLWLRGSESIKPRKAAQVPQISPRA